MDKVKGIPYGISDFNRMRNDNFYFDFSKANLGTGSLEENFNNYCNNQLTDFMIRYASFYQKESMEILLNQPKAANKLQWLEAAAKRLNYPLYLIIDEYDNFTDGIW